MINRLITHALKDTNIPVYYLTRGENKAPCTIFNVIESPAGFTDDVEDSTEYIIMLNLYIGASELLNKVKEITDCMERAGFKKRIYPTARYDDAMQVYNQPMEFIIIRNRR